MKKVLSSILAIVLTLQLASLYVFAVDVMSIVMSYDTETYGEALKAEDTFELNLDLNNNPGIASVKVKVTFDETAFTLTKVTYNDAGLGGMSQQPQTLKSPVTLNWFNGGADTNGDKLYATLAFEVNASAKPGDYDFSIEYDPDDIYNIAGDAVELDAQTYTVTVKGQDFDTLTLTGAGSYIYGDPVNVAVTGAPADAKVEYTVKYKADAEAAEVESDINSIKDAGTYTISATVSKDGYNSQELVPIEVTIAKKGVTISGITAEDKTYDGTTDVTVNKDNMVINGKVGEDDLDATFPEPFQLDSADAGNRSVVFTGTELTGADADNYTLTSVEEVNVTVSPINVTVTIDSITKKVGVDLPVLTYTLKPEKPFVGDTVLEGTPAVEKDWTDVAGKTYKITKGSLAISPEDQKDNYNITFIEGSLTITEANLTDIAVETNETFKKEYYEGETFIADGMTITASYDNNTTADVAANLCKIDPAIMPDVETDGTKQIITIEYNGKTATVEVTVNKDDITAVDAVIADANKVVWVGDEVVIESVTATYESGKTAELGSALYNVVCDTSDKTEEAVVTVTLKADDSISDEETVTVIDKKLTDLEIVEKTAGALSKVAGQTFRVDEGGVQINALYTDKEGTVTRVDVTEKYNDVSVTSNKAGTVVETLKYNDEAYGAYVPEEVSADLKVVFAAKTVTEIEVLSNPDTTKYIEGTAFNPAGVEIKVTYNDGVEITATADDYADYDITFNPTTLELGNTVVTVACGGKTAEISVTVIPRTLTEINVTVNKDEYVDGESFDKADIVVEAVYDNGDVETVTDYTVDAESFVLEVANAEETRTVTVTYGDETDTYEVTVVPCAVINETTGKRYSDIEEAFEEAESGDELSIEIAADDVDVEIAVEIIIINNTGDEITITVNGVEITIDDGDSYTVGMEEEKDYDEYYFFYMQMLQWRNRMFKVTVKQTEGGTITAPASVRNGETAEITITPDEGYAVADVLVNGKSVGAVESYKIRNIRSNQTVSAVFEKLAVTSPFVDVAVDAPYFDAVLYVYENGIINGVSETEMVFAPDTTMTRAMFVTVLGRMSGVNAADYPVVTFADCEAGSWYAPYVEWAAQAGIVNGYSAEAFGPMDEITVEQAAVILYRYIAYMGYNTAADADLANYADGDQVSEWAAEQMKWALANGIYVSDTTLDPQAPAARSLVAEMLYNLSVWMG